MKCGLLLLKLLHTLEWKFSVSNKLIVRKGVLRKLGLNKKEKIENLRNL